jgi:arsenate reductase
MKPRRKKVLFVCIGNSCRSPMAEALARHFASEVIEPMSAGISPLGHIVKPTRDVLREKGIPADGLRSKSLREMDPDSAELIVNMTGMPGKSLFPGAKVVDWEVDDPYGEDLGIYREVCEEIEARLATLAAQLRKDSAAKPKS